MRNLCIDSYTISSRESIEALQNVCSASSHVSVSPTYETNIAVITKRLQGSDKNIVSIPDGIVTKANGSAPSTWAPIVSDRTKLKLPASRHMTSVAQPGIHSFRECIKVECKTRNSIKQVGMPRVRRAYALSENKIDPIMPDSLKRKFGLSDGANHVLVALTQNKEPGSDLHHFLSQIDMDIEDLINQLDEHDITLWIKEHQKTAVQVDANNNIFAESDSIFRVEPREGISSVDILSMMDGMLTDISSIYVDSLPFDIPIGFINFDDYINRDRIFYPESPFWPGEKINSADELDSFLKSLRGQEDRHTRDREYARQVLLGGNNEEDCINQEFWEGVLLKE